MAEYKMQHNKMEDVIHVSINILLSYKTLTFPFADTFFFEKPNR